MAIPQVRSERLAPGAVRKRKAVPEGRPRRLVAAAGTIVHRHGRPVALAGVPAHRPRRLVALAGALALVGACATLQQLIQPLQFSTAPGRQAELRLLGPAVGRPLGGVGVRLWAHVLNPNPVGVNLTSIVGTLFLADNQAGSVNLPLGLPLLAQRDTIFPVDVNVSFAEIPGLAGVFTRAISGSSIPYRLDGRFGVGAGALGDFEFGPQTLLQGNATVLR